MNTTRSTLHSLGPVIVAAAITAGGVALLQGPSSPSAGAAAVTTVACADNVATDTTTLSNAIATAEQTDGTVSIAAGTCALDNWLSLRAPVTIEGAGATATSLVEHTAHMVFFITADHVTVQNINLDTATYNTTPPQKPPDPMALLSTASYTTVQNLDLEAGSGFGIRFVGPNPCYSDQRTGGVMANINATTTGSAGFVAVDFDCENGGTLSNITIHGGSLTMYQDQNITLTGETFNGGGYGINPCKPAWYASGPQHNISVNSVTSANGGGMVTESTYPASKPATPMYPVNSPKALPIQAAQNITATGQTITDPACPNY